MSARPDTTILAITAVLIVWMAAMSAGAPQPAIVGDPKQTDTSVLPLANATEPPSKSVVCIDQRVRNTTSPCSKDDEYVCVLFVLCQLGTIQTEPNGKANRGQSNNHCDYFDDACCKPDLAVIEEYLSRNNNSIAKLDVSRT